MAKETPRLDLTRICFPTNSLRIGDLVERFPKYFTWQSEMSKGLYCKDNPVSMWLMDAMNIERDLAKTAFDIEAGTVFSHEIEINRAEELAGLSEAYQRLGIASGWMETSELARRFEADARDCAKSAVKR